MILHRTSTTKVFSSFLTCYWLYFSQHQRIRKGYRNKSKLKECQCLKRLLRRILSVYSWTEGHKGLIISCHWCRLRSHSLVLLYPFIPLHELTKRLFLFPTCTVTKCTPDSSTSSYWIIVTNNWNWNIITTSYNHYHVVDQTKPFANIYYQIILII